MLARRSLFSNLRCNGLSQLETLACCRKEGEQPRKEELAHSLEPSITRKEDSKNERYYTVVESTVQVVYRTTVALVDRWSIEESIVVRLP